MRTADLRSHVDIHGPVRTAGRCPVPSMGFTLRSLQPLVLCVAVIFWGVWNGLPQQARGEDPKSAIFDGPDRPPLIKRLLTPLTDLLPRSDKAPEGDPFVPRSEAARRKLATELKQNARTASTKNPWGAISPATPLGNTRPPGNARPPGGTAEPIDEIHQAALAGVVKVADPPTVAPSDPAPVEGLGPPNETERMKFDDLPLAQAIMAPLPPAGAMTRPPQNPTATRWDAHVKDDPLAKQVSDRPPAEEPAAQRPPPNVEAVDSASDSVTAIDRTPLHKALVTLPAGKDTPARGGQLDKDSRVLAIVGNQSILAGDVLGRINEVLAPYVDEAPPDELDKQREMLTRQLLPRLVENKLVYMDFLRVVPPDRLPDVEKQASDLFHKEELPKLVKAAGVDTAADYDAKLRESGSSLLKRRREFMEQEFARTMIAKNVNLNVEVSHGEMLEFYEQHAEDYYQKARVRWERIMVRYDQFDSRGEAYQAIAKMGDQIVVKGMPLAVVARSGSQGPNAKEGGHHDWTERESLASEKIDRVLFSLPVGRMSRIIEDGDGYHIVRVIERREAGRRPFAELQDEIQQEIVTARRTKAITSYLSKLKEETVVWTAYGEPVEEPELRVGSPPQSTTHY